MYKIEGDPDDYHLIGTSELTLNEDSTFTFDFIAGCDSIFYTDQCLNFDRGIIEFHWKGNFTYTQEYKEFESYSTGDLMYHRMNDISGEAALFVTEASDSIYKNVEFNLTYHLDCYSQIIVSPMSIMNGKLSIGFATHLPD